MAEEEPSAPRETLIEKIEEKIEEKIHELEHDVDDPPPQPVSSSERPLPPAAPAKPKVFRLFGRERSIHHVLGGRAPADVLLWRNKNASAGVIGCATVIWVLFELVEYHLLTLVCHALILSLAGLFLWSNASTFINKSPPRIPEVNIPEDMVVNAALALRNDINKTFALLRKIASGKDLKEFLIAITGLWILSAVGSWFNFLTLLYTVLVILHTIPYLYEKYEDKVDAFSERAWAEIKKQYAVLDAQVLSKIPLGPLKVKKH